MKTYIKKIALIIVVATGASAIAGFASNEQSLHGESEERITINFASIIFENISLTKTYDVVVDGEVVGSIGPRRSIELEVTTGSHSIVYRNADSGEIASGDCTVTVVENEHLTVYCSYAG